MAMAPTIAGISAYYWSWRTTQFQLFWAASLVFLLTYKFQPETSQPGARGIDKLIEKEGTSRWVWLNPFKNVTLLRSPNVLLVVRDLFPMSYQVNSFEQLFSHSRKAAWSSLITVCIAGVPFLIRRCSHDPLIVLLVPIAYTFVRLQKISSPQARF